LERSKKLQESFKIQIETERKLFEKSKKEFIEIQNKNKKDEFNNRNNDQDDELRKTRFKLKLLETEIEK